MRVQLIGPGRAGTSLQAALTDAGADVASVVGRSDDLRSAASAADLVLLAVPDAMIAAVAGVIEPTGATVAHLSGATSLDVLAPHTSRGSIHPLVSLTGGSEGAEALRGATFALAGSDPTALGRCRTIVDLLHGTSFEVSEANRAAYHATAAVAANHLVALCAQVERLASVADVPVEVFWPLMRGVLDTVVERGAAASLTGPVSRGDWETVRRHLEAIAVEDRALYLALARAAADLAGQEFPDLH